MYCTNCGKQIPDGSAFCTECGAPTGAGAPSAAGTAAHGKKYAAAAAAVIAAAAIVVLLIVMISSAAGGTGLSGTYASRNAWGEIAYEIKFNSDGSCVVTENGYENYSCTYYKSDGGTYVIDFHSVLFGSWVAQKNGSTLYIYGTGIGGRDNGTTFEKIS